MCLSYYTLRRTSHTWNSSPGLTDYWKTVVSHCRLPESGAVQHQGKTQRQTLAERYENSVFRLTSCTVICLMATTARCFVKIAVIDHFRRQQHQHRRIQLLRRSLVRTLCHMVVHMAS